MAPLPEYKPVLAWATSSGSSKVPLKPRNHATPTVALIHVGVNSAFLYHQIRTVVSRARAAVSSRARVWTDCSIEMSDRYSGYISGDKYRYGAAKELRLDASVRPLLFAFHASRIPVRDR